MTMLSPNACSVYPPPQTINNLNFKSVSGESMVNRSGELNAFYGHKWGNLPCPKCGKIHGLHPWIGRKATTLHRERLSLSHRGKGHRLIEEEPSDFQKQIYLGSLLGDGSIIRPSVRPNKKWELNFKFSEAHTSKQLEYLSFKQKLLIPHAKLIKHYTHFIKLPKGRSGFYNVVRFQTYCHPWFTQIRHLLYPNNKKKPVLEYLNLITHHIAVYIWICDDGSYAGGNISIPIVEWGVETGILLQQWLKERFNYEVNIIKATTSPCLNFPVRSVRKMRQDFNKFIEINPSMAYKFGVGDRCIEGKPFYLISVYSKKELKDILYKKYWIEGKSTYQIAKELNVKQGSIWNWFKKLDIPTRNNHKGGSVCGSAISE